MLERVQQFGEKYGFRYYQVASTGVFSHLCISSTKLSKVFTADLSSDLSRGRRPKPKSNVISDVDTFVSEMSIDIVNSPLLSTS